MNEYHEGPAPVSASASPFIRRAVVEAVDHGLLALGEIVRETIYWRIEQSYQLKREEIPENLDAFYKALQELLGRGAEIIRSLIAKDFYGRLDLKFTGHENWTLVDYVRNARVTLGSSRTRDSHERLVRVDPASEFSASIGFGRSLFSYK